MAQATVTGKGVSHAAFIPWAFVLNGERGKRIAGGRFRYREPSMRNPFVNLRKPSMRNPFVNLAVQSDVRHKYNVRAMNISHICDICDTASRFGCLLLLRSRVLSVDL